jgi:hypothetical protein
MRVLSICILGIGDKTQVRTSLVRMRGRVKGLGGRNVTLVECEAYSYSGLIEASMDKNSITEQRDKIIC